MALSPPGFVYVRKGNFYCDYKPFHVAGVVNFGLILNPASFDSNAAVDSVLSWCNTNGITVVRCWAFWDGPNAFSGRSFQNPRGTITSGWWTGGDGVHGMDWVLKRATDFNVRLFLSFNNGWPEEFGGVKQYAQWGIDAGKFAGPASSQKHQFFTHADLRQWYKDQVAVVLNRTNSLTGVQYKNDPAVFAWALTAEVENEPRPVSEYTAWVTEMAAYVKSIDSNHLLCSGMTGFDNTGTGPGTPYSSAATFYSGQNWMFDGTKGTSFKDEAQIANIDFCV